MRRPTNAVQKTLMKIVPVDLVYYFAPKWQAETDLRVKLK